MIIGGGSFGDVGSILSERDRQQQLLLAAQREAMARNDAQTAHTANVGEANFQYHQQQDAIARHQAEQAAQDAQHAQTFARQDVWHGQDVAHQNAQMAQQNTHQLAALAQSDAHAKLTDQRVRDDLAARLAAEKAAATERQQGRTDYHSQRAQEQYDRDTRDLMEKIFRQTPAASYADVRAEALRQMGPMTGSPETTDPAGNDYYYFQKAQPVAPEFPTGRDEQAMDNPEYNWTPPAEKGLTTAAPGAEAVSPLQAELAALKVKAEKDRTREDDRLKLAHTREDRIAKYQETELERAQHPEKPYVDNLRAEMEGMTPEQKQAHLQYEYAIAKSRALPEGTNPEQDADMAWMKTAAANAGVDPLTGRLTTWHDIWERKYKPHSNVRLATAILSLQREGKTQTPSTMNPPDEEIRIGPKGTEGAAGPRGAKPLPTRQEAEQQHLVNLGASTENDGAARKRVFALTGMSDRQLFDMSANPERRYQEPGTLERMFSLAPEDVKTPRFDEIKAEQDFRHDPTGELARKNRLDPMITVGGFERSGRFPPDTPWGGRVDIPPVSFRKSQGSQLPDYGNDREQTEKLRQEEVARTISQRETANAMTRFNPNNRGAKTGGEPLNEADTIDPTTGAPVLAPQKQKPAVQTGITRQKIALRTQKYIDAGWSPSEAASKAQQEAAQIGG